MENKFYSFFSSQKEQYRHFISFSGLGVRGSNYVPPLYSVLWLKARVIYYVNNGVYTTNHKRIAVNYFGFVILGGFVGLILATVVRLELSYPGVGIFAGDSLQYLTLVAAHGVIMVFFMITPVIYGAYGNFLLPTQLGVHDVAFPRLNSAAFGFLPGGLLMLAQLVCVDRRYQRMNCFNIREFQSFLKGKFFQDMLQAGTVRADLGVGSDLRYAVGGGIEQRGLPLVSESEISAQTSRASATLEIGGYGLPSAAQTRRTGLFDEPVFRYDYKAGHFFTSDMLFSAPHLIGTAATLTTGIRPAPGFLSGKAFEGMNGVSPLLQLTNIMAEQSTPFGDASCVFGRHLMTNFSAHTIQQRVYANGRTLRFTREAWRCKALIARHQKNLNNRYLSEDGVFGALERNAKDLIPGGAMITPFSSRTRFTVIGKTDIGLMGVFLVINGSIISSMNFLVTYRYLATLNNRKMRDARSFFTEALMAGSAMIVAANPMLAIAILMLLSDRHGQTSFFDYSGGGDTVLFQHMFGFFGHPEVYIIMIPAFGFVNTILAHYLRKRISARSSLIYSMYTIAFLGFFVGGHHMYMVGLAHTTRMLFSTLTVMISVPAATKLMHWCITLVNSAFHVEVPLIFILFFIFGFVSGGISGMGVAHTGMDILFHDTFFVVGHFHVMLAGSAMYATFGGFYFYFVAIFGVKYSRLFAYFHLFYYICGQFLTVIPMMGVGYAGMPRRVLDYPAALGGWHSIISAGHLLSVAGIIAFCCMIFDSLRHSKPALRLTFGIGRYNTRVNFYLYEIARLGYVQHRAGFLPRPRVILPTAMKTCHNYELGETAVVSYSFTR